MERFERDLIVGSTGFVGGNLIASHSFGTAVHSTNVTEAFGTAPDLCVYAGIPSAMFLANQDREADLDIMRQARANLRKIKPRKVALISTIAVYADSRNKNEHSPMEEEGLPPYGRNRLQLEQWVREDFDDALIVRLPALYGRGIKKNFIKDMICITPPLLRTSKYQELSSVSDLVHRSYADRGDGFYAVRPDADAVSLREWFSHNDFNALSFTDSRSRYQFYDLARLWDDILGAIDAGYTLYNLATPPVDAASVYRFVNGTDWCNILSGNPYDYDMRTVHASSTEGYIMSLQEELEGIRRFVEVEQCRI